MWLMTRSAGFLSVVEHADDDGWLMVRARREQDLAALSAIIGHVGPIVETPDGDYRWRRTVDRVGFGAWLADEVELIDYTTHAKEAMSGDDIALYHAYLRVWSVMKTLQAPPWLLDDDQPTDWRAFATEWLEGEPQSRRRWGRRRHGRSKSHPRG